jgi:hypothetical protein
MKKIHTKNPQKYIKTSITESTKKQNRQKKIQKYNF